MHLEMDHSTLSQVMRGKRAVTERMIRGLGARLRLVEDEMTAFIRYEAVCATERVGAMTVVRQLVHDAASLISDPLHYDILELTRVESFQPDSRWIARVLDTTPDEVNIAVTRLVRLGLMEMVEKNRWVDTSGPETQTRAGFARLVIRRLVERTDESAPDEE
jgi:hypothetical protein